MVEPCPRCKGSRYVFERLEEGGFVSTPCPVCGPRRRAGRPPKMEDGFTECPVCDGTKRVTFYEGKRYEETSPCVACDATGRIPYKVIDSRPRPVGRPRGRPPRSIGTSGEGHWTYLEEKILKGNWDKPPERLLKMLPGRTISSIRGKGIRLGLPYKAGMR